MLEEITRLAFHGRWDDLLPILRDDPSLINLANGSKGYTPLHQAAWHGAPLPVIGELLALGADRGQSTRNKRQTACQIAAEKHPERADLQFILSDQPRTLAQIMRKVLADNPDIFQDYDAGRAVFDRLVECFGSDLCLPQGADIELRIDGALRAVTGYAMCEWPKMSLKVPEDFHGPLEPEFWQGRLLSLLRDSAARSQSNPLEPHWAVVGDLFYPATDQWGARGDPFLWIEMAQALCHVPLSDDDDTLRRRLEASFHALTGVNIGEPNNLFVRRYARGGMSNGMVACSAWNETLVPLLVQRSVWLRQSWQWRPA